MTLETAKRILQENNGPRNKEAEAIVRGGMTYCEQKYDGERVYLWLKVLPTKTDAESSIKTAIEKYQNRKKSRTTTGDKQFLTPKIVTAVSNQDVKEIEAPIEASPITLSQLLNKIKRKMWDLWQQIDEIVIE